MALTQKKIEVTINPDGTTSIEAFGFEGMTCLKETEELEKKLGMVADRSMKNDTFKTTAGKKATIGGK